LHTTAVRRLTGDEHLTAEFATTWRTYELDERTRTLLAYTEKLTKIPSQIENRDTDALREAGWNEDAVYEATCLISFFNFSGRLEAASGLPPDEVPAEAIKPEARADSLPLREVTEVEVLVSGVASRENGILGRGKARSPPRFLARTCNDAHPAPVPHRCRRS
jgi:hypothetical protein